MIKKILMKKNHLEILKVDAFFWVGHSVRVNFFGEILFSLKEMIGEIKSNHLLVFAKFLYIGFVFPFCLVFAVANSYCRLLTK